MSEKTSDTTDRLTDTPVNRGGPDEGARAPFVKGEQGQPIQHSVFDAGEEVIVVTETDEQGQRTQGTGASAAEAADDAGNRPEGEPLGEGFGTAAGH